MPSETRDKIIIATKFGNVYDEQSRSGGGSDVSPADIRAECDASLDRLGIEAIGLYQLHNGAESPTHAEDVVATCEELVAAGKVRAFGTAQDAPEIVEVFAKSTP